MNDELFSSKLNSLKNEIDITKRNFLAIELAETKRIEVLDVLIELIKSPSLADSRATLVHCLKHFKCDDSLFMLLIQLVISGNWEVANEAFDILDGIDLMDGKFLDQAFNVVKNTLQTPIDDLWRKEMIQDLYDMFE